MASKEEMIRDRFERFLDRVFRLQEQLSADEPENAARLARVVERAGELGLAEQLDQIVQLLRDSPALTQTLDAQDRWVQDADRLLAILLERDSDNEQRKQQIEGLQEYKQQLEEILEREQGLRDKTGRAAQAEDANEQGQKQDQKWDHLKEAEKQRDVADQTGALAEKMKQDAESQAEGQGRPGAAGAAQSLEQSQRDMNDAAEKLDENDPAQAGESQDRALEELEQAQKELEEVLNQLRQEDREETLRDLEGRFREMLSGQNAINAATDRLYTLDQESLHSLDRESLRTLDRESLLGPPAAGATVPPIAGARIPPLAGARIPSRTHLGEPNTSFRRAEKLQLADLATKERDLAQRATVCGHVLDEEGTTIVFPHVVGQLAEDMHSAADRLASYNVGSITQDIEQEIVDTLEQLLEAIKTMQQENEQQAESGSSDSDSPPLLPPSAELKLLRSSQVRVNSRTAAIEVARVEGTESPSALAGLLKTATTRQAQCAQIAEETRDRQNRP